jgi:hypothetical protein
MNMKTPKKVLWRTLAFALPVTFVPWVAAQDDDDEDIIELSPFEVTTEGNVGYMAANTLASTGLRTDLRDVGSAVSVVTEEFLRDVGATDNESLLQYTVGTEIGGVQGNFTGASVGARADESGTFTNPNQNTRVRGLSSATNTRNYFQSRIPWDGYNVTRVDMQRGANSILFGLGEPAGIINNTLADARFFNSGEIEFRLGSFGSNRASIDVNREVIDNELAIRLAVVRDREQFRQNPAYDNDDRIYAALQWQPDFLKTSWGMFNLKANFETGNIKTNRPRTLTPLDYITPWFAPFETASGDFNYGLGKETYDPYRVQDNNNSLPGNGQFIRTWNGGELAGLENEDYRPALGNFAQSFESPLVIFDRHYSPSFEIRRAGATDTSGTGAIGVDGLPDPDGVAGIRYHRILGVTGYANYASRAELPNYTFGLYRDFHLSDPTIFDFHNLLMDGPNKYEWADFNAWNVTAAQTFIDNQFGIELALDRQDYDSGRWTILNDSRQGIYIDINHNRPDGTPNPNVGRPFVSDSLLYGNNASWTEREVFRAKAYADLDFRRLIDSESLIARIIGRHIITGVYSDDTDFVENRNWLLYEVGDAYAAFSGESDGAIFEANSRLLNPVVYLGPSLMDRSSASGAKIPNIKTKLNITSSGIYTFDASWNAPTVNPADYWLNPYPGYPTLGDDSTQAENPANYVGWRSVPATITKIDPLQDGGMFSGGANKYERELVSEALVLQSYLLNDALVATWGWRNDEVSTRRAVAPRDEGVTRRAFLDEEFYNLDVDPQVVEKESISWSIAAHVDELLDLVKLDILPFKLSFYYSDGENFQPLPGRADLMANAIPNPSGFSQDRSVLISTRDNRFSLKVTKYDSSSSFAPGANLDGSWYLGALQRWGGNWANIFQYDIIRGNDLSGQASPEEIAAGTNFTRYNYGTAPGETADDAAAREAAAIAGWRAHQERIKRELPGFYDIWLAGVDPTVREQIPSGGYGGVSPAGFSLTQDVVSEGWEFEFIANPTPNWRISINASKTEARRSNVGGEALRRYVDIVEDDLNNTPAGDLRIWWGGSANETTLFQWNLNVGSQWALIALQEGTPTSEIREWRWNVVTNYSFSEGRLKGFNVGGSYRWEDQIPIGFPSMDDGTGRVTYDLENPFYGPTEDFVDLWIGYQTKFTKDIDWRIQLNVQNVFASDNLIPLSSQPDGSPAALRIPPNRVIRITSTFTF